MLKRIAAITLLHLVLLYTVAARIGDNADWRAEQQVRNPQVTEITLCTTVAANILSHALQFEVYTGGLGWHKHSPIKGLLVSVADLLRQKDTEAESTQRSYNRYSYHIAYTPPTYLIFPFHYFT